MNLFQDTDILQEKDELWEGANTTSLLPPELELESRILETKDYEILEAKKIIDKYITLKKQLKEYKNDYNECEEIYENYLSKKKELSSAILNFTNSINNIQTLISSIDFNNQLNNLKSNNHIDNNLLNELDNNNNFKHTKEIINYLLDVNTKINNGDIFVLQKINQENSRLHKNCNNIEDKMKIIRNLIMISIKETTNENEENQLKIDSKTCPICFENDVFYCLNPCGHLICNECSNQINNSCKCPTCRQQYSSKIKVYFNI
jgi:hypothetical protein